MFRLARRGYQVLAAFLAVSFTFSYLALAQMGAVDEGFQPGISTEDYYIPSSAEYAVLAGDGNKTYVWGGFSRVNGQAARRLVRLEANGAVDTAFSSPFALRSRISMVQPLPGGKVLVSGTLRSRAGLPLQSVVRLRGDGTIDEGFVGIIYIFNPAEGLEVDNIGTSYVYGPGGQSKLFKLKEDGGIDPGFNTPFSGFVYMAKVKALPQGKVLVGGDLSFGISGSGRLSGGTQKAIMVRLNSNGELDPEFSSAIKPSESFQVPGPNLQDFAVMTDGKIVIGGSRLTEDSNHIPQSVARLNADGSLDGTFQTAFAKLGYCSEVVVQSDGKVITSVGFDGEEGRSLVRLNSNGTLDDSFVPSVAATNLTPFLVRGDGRIIMGSLFGEENRFMALMPDGSVDDGFQTRFEQLRSWTSLATYPDGRILGGNSEDLNFGQSLARFLPNGTVDADFRIDLGPSYVFSVQPDLQGRILMHGVLRATNAQGDSLVLTDVARFGVDGAFDTDFYVERNGQIPRGLSRVALASVTDGRVAIYGFAGRPRSGDRPAEVFNGAGVLDPVFGVGSTLDSFSHVDACLWQPDGKLIISGLHYSATDNQLATSVIRLNADGSDDAGFRLDFGDEQRFVAVEVMPDRGIIIGREQQFSLRALGRTTGNQPEIEASFPCLMRLKEDGKRDLQFSANLGTNAYINGVKAQRDGRLLVFGDLFDSNDKALPSLIRLNPDGSRDSSLVTEFSSDVLVNAVTVLASGDLMVAGSFDQWNGVPRPGLVRLKSVELPRLKPVSFSGGGLQFDLEGNQGRQYEIQSSSDLKAWTVEKTVSTEGTDVKGVELPVDGDGKFYRVRVVLPE